MSRRKLTDLNVQDRAVLCRVDFNVPLDGTRITDDRRIRAAMPTVQWLTAHGAKVVCASHLGRPKGKRVPEMSLAPVAARLGELLGQSVKLADDCIGAPAQALASSLAPGRVGLLENLRFHKGETDSDAAFAAQLAQPFAVYVNDAFGAAHRPDASVALVPRLIADRAAGFLMDKEVASLTRLLVNPERPYVAILGGAKVSDKIDLVEQLLARVDGLLVGGAMAYTFLAARGVAVGASLVEHEKLELASTLEAKARERGVAVYLPIDHVTCAKIDGRRVEGLGAEPSATIGAGRIGVDIGPGTIAAWRTVLGPGVRTVLWNGPLGLFEAPGADAGTRAIAEHLAGLRSAFRVLGGGDTAAAATQFGLDTQFDHVSTGGGAALEMLSGLELPGVTALED